MRSLFLVITSVVVLIISTAAHAKEMIGLVENVLIQPGGLVIDAKIDTGADNSSIDASDMVRFKRRGESWVRFRVVKHDGTSETLERELVRVARVKRPSGKSQRRPVVMLGLCLGATYREVEVTLVDRSRFRYRMIVGRSFLGNDFLVDPSKKNTTQPACSKRKGN
jgi:hypothetical protein